MVLVGNETREVWGANLGLQDLGLRDPARGRAVRSACPSPERMWVGLINSTPMLMLMECQQP